MGDTLFRRKNKNINIIIMLHIGVRIKTIVAAFEPSRRACDEIPATARSIVHSELPHHVSSSEFLIFKLDSYLRVIILEMRHPTVG
jgi:hypothetical protein